MLPPLPLYLSRPCEPGPLCSCSNFSSTNLHAFCLINEFQNSLLAWSLFTYPYPCSAASVGVPAGMPSAAVAISPLSAASTPRDPSLLAPPVPMPAAVTPASTSAQQQAAASGAANPSPLTYPQPPHGAIK